MLEAMEADSGIAIKQLRVDGGGAMNDLLLEFQAGILGVQVVRPKVFETTALGAAYLAGLAVGYWESQADVTEQWQVDRTFEPGMDAATVERLQLDWRRALERSRGWAQPEAGE